MLETSCFCSTSRSKQRMARKISIYQNPQDYTGQQICSPLPWSSDEVELGEFLKYSLSSDIFEISTVFGHWKYFSVLWAWSCSYASLYSHDVSLELCPTPGQIKTDRQADWGMECIILDWLWIDQIDSMTLQENRAMNCVSLDKSTKMQYSRCF